MNSGCRKKTLITYVQNRLVHDAGFVKKSRASEDIASGNYAKYYDEMY